MISKAILRIILFCTIIFIVPVGVLHAQGPDEDETQVVIPPSGRIEVTLKQLGYETRRYHRNRSERFYRVDLPGNFQISPTGNYIDLVTYHNPPIPDKTSVLRTTLDGRPVNVFSLTENNAISSTIRANLPVGVLHTGVNTIRMDLDTGGTCFAPGALVDLYVDQESTISFGYQQFPYPTDLSLYPFPFTEKSIFNIPVTIVLPEQPTLADISAASTVAAGLGKMSGGAIDLKAVFVDDLDISVRNNDHLILIGKPDNHALIADLDLPLSIDTAQLKPGQGIIEEIVSPWNEFRLILIVSGLEDEGVLKASYALNRKAHFLGMRGPAAIVTELNPVQQPTALRAASMTLASLGYDDQVIYGTSPQDYLFRFNLPPGWRLERPPFFTLEFAHAEILDPFESAMDISLNDVPIGSTLLDAANTDNGVLTVSLPARTLETGRNSLKVSIEMNPRGSDRDPCGDVQDKRIWTVISNESEVFLPYDAGNLRADLRLFPYPFSQNSNFEQTLFVLPDQLSPQILNDLIRLATQMGSSAQTERIAIQVASGSDIGEGTLKSYHIILLGRASQNTLLREVNQYLPQPFARDGDTLAPLAVDSVAFVDTSQRDAGLLQIIASPWNERYSLLAIGGTTDEGIQLAVETLLTRASALRGNLAVVEEVANPFAEGGSQISTYTIDTRPSVAMETRRFGISSDTDLVLLAGRWWK